MSEDMKMDCLEISEYLYKNVYNHKKLLDKTFEAEKIIFKFFDYFEKILINFLKIGFQKEKRNKTKNYL